MRTPGAFILWSYFFVAFALTALDYKHAYWPTILAAVLAVALLSADTSRSNKVLFASYLALCALTVVAGLLYDLLAGVSFSHFGQDFIEGQFWGAVLFYSPLLIVLLCCIAIRSVAARISYGAS